MDNTFIYEDYPYGIKRIDEIAKFPRFQAAVRKRWQETRGDLVPYLRKEVNAFIDKIVYASQCDCKKWPEYGNKNVLDLKTEKKVMMPFFKQIFQVAIGSPRGDRMSFQKVINFILWLKRNGFNIGIVSTDQYQSAYVRENLEHQGFSTEKISVDRTIDPYISLRNLLQDQRLELIKCDLQEIELINLQRNNDRIDHKPQTNAGNEVPCLSNGYNSKGIGKDCADALCGACSSLIAHLDLIKPAPKSVINAITSVNTGRIPNRYGTGIQQPLPGFGSQYRKFK
jgi:hypothetical protein